MSERTPDAYMVEKWMMAQSESGWVPQSLSLTRPFIPDSVTWRTTELYREAAADIPTPERLRAWAEWFRERGDMIVPYGSAAVHLNTIAARMERDRFGADALESEGETR